MKLFRESGKYRIGEVYLAQEININIYIPTPGHNTSEVGSSKSKVRGKRGCKRGSKQRSKKRSNTRCKARSKARSKRGGAKMRRMSLLRC